MESGGLPLERDRAGAAVRDLQRRLARAGFEGVVDESHYGPRTEDAVRRFQAARGLRVDGRCGEQTWAALVEAGFSLGDRLLYHRQPMLRGDDVADVQQRLGALGFHAGRVDGIFGPDTAQALREFQRNIDLASDGICGPDTVSELRRLGVRGDQQVKAGVLEDEHLRRGPRQLLGRHVVVGETGGLSQLAAATSRSLQRAGAVVLTSHHPDGAAQAAEANAFQADVYVGLTASDTASATVAYYGSPGYISRGGKRLAVLAVEQLEPLVAATTEAMRLPVLRETRMPAVLCEVGPPGFVVARSSDVAEALVRSLLAWISAPVGDLGRSEGRETS